MNKSVIKLGEAQKAVSENISAKSLKEGKKTFISDIEINVLNEVLKDLKRGY